MEFWHRLSRHSRGLVVVAGIGFVLGATFGDMLFEVVELAVGNGWDELVFGIGGATVACLGYEIFKSFRRKP